MSAVVASRLVVHRSPASRCKQLLLGPPLTTSRLVRQRLGKLVALAVFSSDAISSTAYGTEQIMLVLLAAGAAATGLALPIAVAVRPSLAHPHKHLHPRRTMEEASDEPDRGGSAARRPFPAAPPGRRVAVCGGEEVR